ncbi:unnamed protein product [Pleuronectes platessa]|uniref:Tower domain-containing protein n=1 Tax=Pleuronectes platessa TaxID=8262 RepID=A0A9N7U011_PLEPL|nr:unnamed protein product [Pleuronectes platessa]
MKDKTFFRSHELGPLDPDWFHVLSAQTSTSEGNGSDQDELCANQEGNFKAPCDRTALESQLFSTPKVFRRSRVVSPETEGVVSPEAAQNPESHNSPQDSPHPSPSVWRQKLPDAIEDGDVRSTVASVLDGAENVLSMFFSNSSSALRKVKTDRIKRKQIISTKERVGSFTDVSITNSAASLEQRTDDREPVKISSPPPQKTRDTGITQWSPLSLSDIPPSSVDSSCRDNNHAATQVDNKTVPEQLRSSSDSSQLTRPHLTGSYYGFTKKKRQFVYTIETPKPQAQGNEPPSVKNDTSPRIPGSGNKGSAKLLGEIQDETDCCRIKEDEIQKQKNDTEENLPLPVQPKAQELDMSQLCRDFAQDFSQMLGPGKPSEVAEDTPQNGFSPSTCLNAMKQAKQRGRQANVPLDCDHTTKRKPVSATAQNYSINEGTGVDSGFHSAVADISHLTSTSFILPSSENNAQSQQKTGFKTETQRPASSLSTNIKHVKYHQGAETDAKLPSAVKEGQTLGPYRESEFHIESTSTELPSGATEGVDTINHFPVKFPSDGNFPERATVSLPSVHTSGFKTASNKAIEVSPAHLERAKHLFEENEPERPFSAEPTKRSSGAKEEIHIKSLQEAEAFFEDCDIMDRDNGTMVKYESGVAPVRGGGRGAKVSVSATNLLKAKNLFKELADEETPPSDSCSRSPRARNGCSETQQRFLAQEALDCTKALLEDESLSVTSEKEPVQDYPGSNATSAEEPKGRGKRLGDDANMTGQPPLKRRLLEEFDRTVVGPRGLTLQPQKTCPDSVMKDRRAFKFQTSPHPNITQPHRNGKNYVEAKLQNTTPTQQCTSGGSRSAHSNKPAFAPPFLKNAKMETCKDAVLKLYGYGVHQHVSEISSETAEAFRFNVHQFLKLEAFTDGGGVQLADGGWLIPSKDGTAGKDEFYKAMCDTPGVDPKLMSEEWVFNHFRWIVWKQASMERSFPEAMGGLCLTPQQVLLQLKYRYDVEIDHSRRPALRRIMEKDDTSAKSLVLCVCGVVSRGHSSIRPTRSDTKTPQGADAKVESPFAVVWLTDGWYAIKAQLDEPLTAMLHKGRLAVGGKLIVYGAQLVGSQEACSPLEAPESLMLKICANSTRPARWDTKLGFHRDPRPFLLPVSSLYSNGGPVGCVDITILRSYPIQWMERKPDAGVVFRSGRAEEKEERRYSSQNQKSMEILFAKIQTEFEKEQTGRRTISRQDIANLQDGEELYEAVEDDPAYLEAHLSEQQMETVQTYRRSLMEKEQAELQDRYRRALEAQSADGTCPKRDVTPVWKLCVLDSMGRGSVYQLNFWRPSSDLQALLKEGRRYKVYNLSTSEGKKRSGIETVQLTGTKKTQFQDLQAQEWLSEQFQPRVSTSFLNLQNPEFQPLCGEVDLTGFIISIMDGQGSSPAFYLADGELNFVKVRCFSSFAQSGLEDVVKPRVLLALSNLQLRGQSLSPTPVVYAGDLTVFSTNPKEVHLQESLSQLRHLLQGQQNFFLTAEEKLLHLLKSDGLRSISSPAVHPLTPAGATDRRQDTKKSLIAQQPIRSVGSFTPVSGNLPAPTSLTEKDPKSLKRRRALDYLCRIPSPPALSHLGSVVTPCVKKTFNPPRRSETPSTLKTEQTPARKPVVSPKEGEWVNDEELAMIDTQNLGVGDLM